MRHGVLAVVLASSAGGPLTDRAQVVRSSCASADGKHTAAYSAHVAWDKLRVMVRVCAHLIGATDGCRHRRGAYSLYRLGSSAHSGSPCDPLHTGAFRLSLHVTVRGLHAFDGASLWLAFVFATEPSLEVAPPAPRRLPIVDGSVEWRSEPLTHSEDPGLAQLHYILDRDADGVCDPDLDLGGVLEATAVDLVSMRVSYDLGAAEVTERPAPAWVCEGFE
jgi:hypothetical protein